MTTTTTTVIVSETPHTALAVRVISDQTHASGVRSQSQRRVPLTMPRSQEYYWHSRWQKDERANLTDLVAGHSIRFDSDDPEDAAHWLDSSDDADPG